jgi:hypothetical protein
VPVIARVSAYAGGQSPKPEPATPYNQGNKPMISSKIQT